MDTYTQVNIPLLHKHNQKDNKITHKKKMFMKQSEHYVWCWQDIELPKTQIRGFV